MQINPIHCHLILDRVRLRAMWCRNSLSLNCTITYKHIKERKLHETYCSKRKKHGQYLLSMLLDSFDLQMTNKLSWFWRNLQHTFAGNEGTAQITHDISLMESATAAIWLDFDWCTNQLANIWFCWNLKSEIDVSIMTTLHAIQGFSASV